MKNFFKLTYSPAPKGSTCPDCKLQDVLEISRTPISGPYSGFIKCTNCDFKSGLMNYFGRTLFTTQPLPSSKIVYHMTQSQEPHE